MPRRCCRPRPSAPRDTLARRADADDGAGDGVRGRDRNAERGGEEQRDRAAGLGAEAAHRLQLGDALAHGLHDAPAAEHRAQRRSPRSTQTTTQSGGSRVVRARRAGRDQQHPDDADGLLRVVAAVAEAVERRRDELQAPEPAIDPRGVERRKIHDTATISSEPSTKPSSGEMKMKATVLRMPRGDQRADARLGHRRRRRGRRSARATTDDGMP